MIYFYGGAFNPMTLSHLEIIKFIINKLNINDKLIIGITSHDYKIYEFDFKLRKRILKENLKQYTNIEIIKQDQRTWKFFHTLPYKDITMVIGEDEWKDLKAGKWHYSNEILNTYKIITIPRVNDISATKVRELLKNNASKDELLKYITEETYKIIRG